MKKIIFAAAVCLMLAGCYSSSDARNALENQGFTDVKIDGHAWFACDSKSDTFATKFEATNPQGKRVSGAVCSGLLKNATVRW